MKRVLGNQQKIFRGIEDEKQAFSGPRTVQIDLTDRCNNTCIACWVHSPLVDKKEVFPEGIKELPFDLARKLIEELHRLGTREIILSGSGEPLLYPKINEVIRIIKSKGTCLNLITNATLINEAMAKLLVKYKVDLITASIWAGSPKTYILTHPGKTESDFAGIKNNLARLAFYKKKYRSLKPHLKLYNVICSKNYGDIKKMVEFAKDVDSDSVEFQVVDVISGKTESLAVTDLQKEEIIKQAEDIRKRNDLVAFNAPKETALDRFSKEEFLDFGKIWKGYKESFSVSQYSNSFICKKGYSIENKRLVISESTSTKQTHPVAFWYKFKSKLCKSCDESINCLDDYGKISIKFLNILGIGSFLRRLLHSDLERGIYEKQINSMPCYIGWQYSRILTNGNVIPCCKAARFPLGNLFNDSFSKIWHSSGYNEFRFKAKNLSKNEEYFSKINCIKSCDNWGMNLEIHNRWEEFKLRDINKNKAIIIKAKDFVTGNLNPGEHNFGKGLVIHGGERQSFAEYEFNTDISQEYEFWSRYASGESRPVAIYIDGKLIRISALDRNTGGWITKFLKWNKEFEINLNKGKHILRICTSAYTPHIEKLAIFKKGRTPSFIEKEEGISYFAFIRDYLLRRRVKESVKKVSSVLKIRNLKDLRILGIFDGQYGYKGPFHIQIDLTNNCNNSCIACWCNSPLLKEARLTPEEKRQYLPLGLVKELLDEVSGMGATEVYYSGSGEPFMHPQIMEVLEYTKKKNLTCHVNTNFTLLDKDKLDYLINIGVDFLTVSTWSATNDTYLATHLNRTKDDFCRMKDNLIYINTRKNVHPQIKLYNVIFNMNYFELEKMVEFAAETKSESLEFTLVDTIPGATDSLALNKEQFAELRELGKRVKSKLDKGNRVNGNGVLIFQFDQFLRRISVADDVQEAKYDRNIIDSIPCYIGWLFARVIPNGEIHSCLKSHRIPTGSLYLKRFSEIWNSSKQVAFRKKTLVCQKKDHFFRLIGNDPFIEEAGCYKSCDDIGRNTWMHNRIKMLSLPERFALKGAAKALKTIKKLKPKKENRKIYHKHPMVAGIQHGRKAFTGPEQVAIDPTNKCNLRCISCWLYSPLLKKARPSDEWLKKELSKEALIRLIDDLASLGTKRIRFTGGGEPFMHKDLMEIIEYARRKQLLVAVTTNFGLVSKQGIKRLIDIGLEELCVSIWASNADTYSKVHPQTSSTYFNKLKENLLYLKSLKKDKTRITFANVIMNNNLRDFEEMHEFGLQYGADTLYFTIVDVLSGQTDKLLLNEEQRKQLLEKALKIKEKNEKDNVKLEFFDGFLRRLSKSQEDFEKGEYDKFDVDRIPCYAGWVFSRILADGNVAPCCRGVKKIMGNINEDSFKSIWNSARYNEFRAKAKYLSKSDNYFKQIGCIKECDNLMHNEQLYKRLCTLGLL